MTAALIHALTNITLRARTDVTAIKGKDGRQAWTRESLTTERLERHLNGGPARGVCFIKAGESTTMLALLDLDSHKGEVTWDRMVEVAQQVCMALEMYGLEPIPWRSSGGRGIHLYMLWDEPQDAYSVRRLLTGVLEQMGYRNGAGGVGKGQIEVFPKQDSVPADGFGNQAVLPLAGQSVPLINWEPADREAAVGLPWPSSAPVAVLERPARAEVAHAPGSADTARLRAALDCIPNTGEHELDYDAWRNIIFAIHHATEGSEEGRAIAHEFSAKAGKYDPDFLDERVWPYIKDREGGVTELSIYLRAREHGFEAVTADDFATPAFEVTADGEVVEVVAGDDVDATPPYPTVARDKAGAIMPLTRTINLFLAEPRWTHHRLGRDEFLDQATIVEPGETKWRPLRDTDIERLRIRFDEIGFKTVSTDAMRAAARLACERNTYDSGRQWAEGLEWDGVERVGTSMQTYFGCEPNEYARAVGVYLFTALAGRLLDPGCQIDMVPVLVGRQGTRKSTGVKCLAPTPEAYTTVSLEKLDDNVARRIRGRVVVELGELRGLWTKESEHIKDWITRGTEDWVPKFFEYATLYKRRCLLIGTTNNDEILADSTGERRWLPIRTGQVDTDALTRDRDQLWAEAVAMWKSGGVQWRGAEKLARGEHDDFKVVDSWTDPIAEWLDRNEMEGTEEPRKHRGVTVHEVLVGAIGFQLASVTKAHEMRVSKILQALGLEKKRRMRGGRQIMGWGCTPCTPQDVV